MSAIVQLLICAAAVAGCATAICAWRRSVRARRDAESRLRATQNEIAGILDNLGSGLVIVDSRGGVRRVNPAAGRILGVDASACAGKDCGEAFADGLKEFADCLLRVGASGSPETRREITISRGERAGVPVGVTVTLLESPSGARDGVIAIFQDLTDVVRMREHVRDTDRLAAVGELSASIAHEIRNPLGSIRGSAELLQGELDIDGTQKQLLDLILKESGRVNRIITDFLAFARMRPTQQRPVDIGGFLDNVAFQIRLQKDQGAGEVVVEVERPDPGIALALDEEQMTQVFLNLALNAVQAMPEGGRLRLAAEPRPGRGDCVVTVTDDGPGIPAEIMEDLFKPFFTTKKGGTGLGLPMVARIVHAHGGMIGAGAAPGGGARFTLELPLADDDADVPPLQAIAD